MFVFINGSHVSFDTVAFDRYTANISSVNRPRVSFAFFVIYFVIYFVDSHWDFVREILNLTLQVLKPEGKFFAQVKILKHCNLDCVVV